MRSLEVALRAVAKGLAIPDPTKDFERNWGAVLAKIKQNIDPSKIRRIRTGKRIRNSLKRLMAILKPFGTRGAMRRCMWQPIMMNRGH